MNDTDPKITAKLWEMTQSRSPQERLRMGCSMHDFSKKLVIEAIWRETPKISAVELKRELFLRFYGQEFSEVDLQKIIERLR